jgi:hypothetical protein
MDPPGGAFAGKPHFFRANTGTGTVTYDSASAYHAEEFISDGTNDKLYISTSNSLGTAAGTVGRNATYGITKISIGGGIIANGTAGNGTLNGDICEVLVYNTDQSANRTAIETYLQNKWMTNSFGNYALVVNSTTIASAGVAVSARPVTLSGSKNYDGSASFPGASLTIGNNLDGGNLTLSGTATLAGANVGSQAISAGTLSLGGSAAGNYTLTGLSGSVTINPLPVVLTGSRTYDGTTNAMAAILSVVNVVSGDTVTVDSGTGGLASANVGVRAITSFGDLVIGGASVGNYTLSGASGSVTIGTATVVPSVTVASSKVYDGTTNASITARSLSGIIGSDDVNLGTSGTAAFTDKNVGTGKPVNITGLSLSGTTAGNYALNTTSTNTMADITERTLIVSATGVDKAYDGTTNATVNLSDDRVSGDSLTIAYTAAFEDPNVGTGKPVDVTGISITGGMDQNNYILGNTTTNTTANITPASVSVTVSSSVNPSGYHDSVTFTATVPSEASGDVIFKANGTPLGTNTVSTGTATNVTATLPRGTNTITAEYSGDGNYLGSTNALAGGQVVTNHPPVAADATYYRAKNTSLKIAIADLLTNVTDLVDGDTITLSSVGAGTNNATILTNDTYVLYSPSTDAGSNLNDTVAYTVSDGFGGSATANIFVNVYSAAGSAQLSIPTNGVVNIQFFGIPNYTYVVQTTTNLSMPWWPVSTNIAGTNGSWQFTDPNATNAQQYYRSAQP